MTSNIDIVKGNFTGAGIVGHSKADKAKSRQRILDAASLQLRELGFAGISIGELMKSAKLTHGGFYGHFESREDLVAQALDQALTDGEASAVRAGSTKGPRTLKSFLNNYLSRIHRDDPSSGCAFAALAGDVARADQRSRDIMTRHAEAWVDTLCKLLDDDHAGEFAMSVMCAVVGAVTLSRAVGDEALSDKLLLAARKTILEQAAARQSSGN
ncbi:TetR/AcrR family transcriptional regulator [Bradyrhizobium tropiciagri]|uniref:TetR/AcrR family transcriptional regulator n=1 Tax=Bradyrhizobium tropiciagri TaxID=312253 RepID=UPI001FCE24ED|nr:TetR/AcrR family transcriptional regulator [Bradyrhizobium tropiciagri]